MDTTLNEKKSPGRYLLHKMWYVLILLLFWAVVFLICRPFDDSKGFQQQINAYDPEVTTSLVGMIKDRPVEQHFIAEKDNLNKILYTTGTCGRENTGILEVKLRDAKTKKVLAKDKKNVATLPDVDFVTFEFPEIKDAKGKEFILSFTADSALDSCIVLMGSKSEKLEPAIVEGKKENHSLRMAFGYRDTNYLWLRVLVFVLVMIISFVLVMLVRGTGAGSFLLIAVTFGLLFSVINPFPHAMDEATHFFRSYMISQGDFVDEIDSKGNIGGYVSDNYPAIVDKTLKIESFLNDSEDYTQPFSEKESFFVNPYMSSYIPVNHAPGALGLWIGRLLHLDIIWCIWLGRMTTLLVYILLCFTAIHKAEYYRSIYFVVACLPLGLFMASSYSADPLLIAACLMFISICLKYRFNQEQHIKVHELLLLLLGVALIASSKYLIYIPVLLLFFMIPRKCFGKKITYILEIITAVLIVIAFGLMAFALLSQFNYVEDRNGHVDMAEQVAFLLENKLLGLGYLADSFFETLFNSVAKLGFQYWSTPVLEHLEFIVAFMYILVAVGAEKKYEFESDGKRIRTGALFLVLTALMHALTVGALYLGYTPVGRAYAEGVQARYLLPLAPMILLGLGFIIPMKHKMKHAEETLSVLMIIICLNVLCGFIMVAFD